MIRTRAIRVVVAEFTGQAQLAVPAAQREQPVVFLVVAGITDAFRDIPCVLLGVRVRWTQTVPGVVAPWHRVLPVRADHRAVDRSSRTEVVLLAELPKEAMISAI